MPAVLFTSESSKQWAQKALAVRRANREKRKTVFEKVDWLIEKLKALSETSTLQPDMRLTRVRKQLSSIDDRVEAMLRADDLDSKCLKELVEAQIRLSEQERILSGRPLPGSRRPAKESSKKSASVDPLES